MDRTQIAREIQEIKHRLDRLERRRELEPEQMPDPIPVGADDPGKLTIEQAVI